MSNVLFENSKKCEAVKKRPKRGKDIKDIVSVHKGPNVILHLKCKMTELYEYQKMIKRFENNSLVYEPMVPTDNFIPYEEVIDHSYSSYIDESNLATTSTSTSTSTATINNNNNTITPGQSMQEIPEINETDNKLEVGGINNICLKLKDLKLQLYKNMPSNKCSACFWCSYDYMGTLCYIPKHIINDVIYGYGSFCTPECAVAYLIKENMDDTTRYERYYLLNYLYGNGKRIKPSPNPYYTLDKYYGNLSIEEYRKLIKTDHLFVTIDKPMTRIFPEIHEENEESLMGGKESKTIKNNNRIYKVKMQNDPPTNEVVLQKGKVNPFPFLDKPRT